MRKILCSIQQDHIPRDRIPALEAALARSYAAQFGGAAPFVIWCEVPRGQAYTEGRLAGGSWLMVEVADGLDQALREKAMLAIAGDFARTAGVAVEKLLVTLCDSTLLGEYLAANSNRMPFFARMGYTLRLLLGLWSSRRRDGYASMAANY